MVTNNLPTPQLWTGLATYNGALYRVEVVARSRLWESEARQVVRKAGGYARDLDQPVDVDRNSAFVFSMEQAEVRYDVRFTPDNLLTNGAMNRKPVTVRMRGNYSKVKDGELQRLPPVLRNPPRPQPMQGQLRRPLRR